MTRWFDRLNLAPQERRLVLAAIVVIALLLNYWIVWPFFQDWPKVNRELEELNRMKGRYTAETSKTNEYNTLLASLRSKGAQVAPEDAPTRLQVAILTNANATNLLVTADHGFIYQAKPLADSDFLSTFHHLLNADVLIGSKSGMSHLAGMLGQHIKIMPKMWHSYRGAIQLLEVSDQQNELHQDQILRHLKQYL